jgi:hypothetical protein
MLGAGTIEEKVYARQVMGVEVEEVVVFKS